ncbi:MAG: hypothetical protein A3J66_02120 [Candidatus Magasanikbacteria bacterium RIFCSPHIGHO2_02_FULL_47_14]|uniref:NADH:ubiquinone reductase (non-electrogenic) n=1 Tax=Candidatus Magasanikbacteria bacterium RIFCSPHIGHO2_02_FULL_47_14 TaxID=1798680 RepID=A0A1F6MBA5_9BACT|nr:MAG: hypothetical protein A3J66_02120 [Candidatus Magasanikbacteria bacterium RIFCSPHIGHO2_02_FULL_47_14]
MTEQKKTRILILGAGFGGVYAFKKLHKIFHGNKNIELIIVNTSNYFLFTPLLHEVATGGISPENVTEPLRKVLGCCLVDLYVAEVTRVDLKKKNVETTVGVIAYDYLLMALGSTTQFFDTLGAEENSFTLKNLSDALRLKNHYLTTIERASKIADREERKKMLRIAIVGGGPTGVELAAETAELFYNTFNSFYSEEIIQDIEIILLQRGKELIPMFSEPVRKRAMKELQKDRVKIKLNTAVHSVTKEGIRTTDGEILLTHTVIWVAGVTPHQIDIDGNITKNTRGCIMVSPTMQVAGHPEVFVIGDMAHCPGPNGVDPLPAMAQVAVAQGRKVAKNIAALIFGKKLDPINYQSKGMLISLGEWMAAGDVKGFHFSGKVAWWLWRTVYLTKLISWQKKLQVALDWTIDLFSPRDISEFDHF